MKIIFFDKNKKLCELAKTIPEIEVRNCDVSDISADAISTASNPDFSFSGGIDAELAKRFGLKKGDWLDIQKGDAKIKNIVLNITVNSDLTATKELVRKAYANFFNAAKNQNWETVAICGFGSGIGCLPDSTVIEALREAVDMYQTIVGLKNFNLLDIKNLFLNKINNLILTDCGSATMTNCWSATMTNCWSAKMTDCAYAKMTDCGSAKMTDCWSAKMTDCEYAKMTDCGSAKMTDCAYAKMTDCGSDEMTDCF